MTNCFFRPGLLATIVLMLGACQKEGHFSKTTEETRGGLVTTCAINDLFLDNPVDYAKVIFSQGTTQRKMDVNGLCSFAKITYTDGVAGVDYYHPDLVPIRRVYLQQPSYVPNDFVILEKKVKLAEFPATNGKVFVNNGTALSVPGNAFQLRSTGSPYTGIVQVHGMMEGGGPHTRFDQKINGLPVYIDSSNNKKFLSVMKYYNLEFTGAAGEALDLAPGKALQTGRAVAPEGIHVYYFDAAHNRYERGQEEVPGGPGGSYIYITQLKPFIIAKTFDLAEVKGKILSETNQPMPGLQFRHNIVAVQQPYQTSFNYLPDSAGNFHFYLPAGITLERTLYTPFTHDPSSPFPEEITLPEITLQPGINDMGTIRLPRTYTLVNVQGSMVDSFMNPMSSGTVSPVFKNESPSLYGIGHGPLRLHSFDGPTFTAKVQVANPVINALSISYTPDKLTMMNDNSAKWCNTQYQMLLAPVNGVYPLSPIIHYDFSDLTKKGAFHINGQRYVSPLMRPAFTGGNHLLLQFDCASFDPTKEFAEVRINLPVSDPFQGWQKSDGIWFYTDDTDPNPEKWTAVGDVKVLIYSGDPGSVSQYPFPQRWIGLLKGTFKTPSGQSKDVKLIFDTWRP